MSLLPEVRLKLQDRRPSEEVYDSFRFVSITIIIISSLGLVWFCLKMGSIFAKKKVSKVTEHDKAVLVRSKWPNVFT